MLKSIVLPIGIDLYITGNINNNELVQQFTDQGAHVKVSTHIINNMSNDIRNSSIVVINIHNNVEQHIQLNPLIYVEIGIAIALKKSIYVIDPSSRLDLNIDYKHLQYVSSIVIT